MSIGEFSERCGLSPKRLRTYAASGLLVPAAVDAFSGYRYYTHGQVCTARLIDALRQAGMPLAEIESFLSRPSGERLDAWARQVVDDAARRRTAIDRARRLLAGEAPRFPSPDEHPAEEIPMTMWRTAGRTDTGHVRESNQDTILSGERLAVVADGLGGHSGGEVASATAVGLLQAAFTGRSADELSAAVRAANRAIWDRASITPELAGMGTTVCAAGLTDDGQLAVVHVGDSRAYLLHGGSLTRLTDDHSVTAELVRHGELSEEDAQQHPHHGILTRALGIRPDVELDVAAHPAEEGDRLLLCTDGLFNEVPVTDIASLMATDDLEETADALVELAIARGGRDNVSVVVAEFTG